jgi:hypothetical protein
VDRKRRNEVKKPTQNEWMAALVELSTLRFFPSDERAQRAVVMQIGRFCDRSDGLAWLISEFLSRVGEWSGSFDARGIYCTQFAAADGVNVWCRIYGYRFWDLPHSQRLDLQIRTEKTEAARYLPLGQSEARRMLASLEGAA